MLEYFVTISFGFSSLFILSISAVVSKILKIESSELVMIQVPSGDLVGLSYSLELRQSYHNIVFLTICIL